MVEAAKLEVVLTANKPTIIFATDPVENISRMDNLIIYAPSQEENISRTYI